MGIILFLSVKEGQCRMSQGPACVRHAGGAVWGGSSALSSPGDPDTLRINHLCCGRTQWRKHTHPRAHSNAKSGQHAVTCNKRQSSQHPVTTSCYFKCRGISIAQSCGISKSSQWVSLSFPN